MVSEGAAWEFRNFFSLTTKLVTIIAMEFKIQVWESNSEHRVFCFIRPTALKSTLVLPEVRTPSGPSEISEQGRKVSRSSVLWDPAAGLWAAAEDQGSRVLQSMRTWV